MTLPISIVIDLGTSFTGYCFQFKEETKIHLAKWGREFGDDTPKTPTCILFGEDGRFLKFGYDAVTMYTRLVRKSKAKNLYFFNNFKMELYGKELHRDLKIEDRTGKEMRAMKVFSESLEFIKDQALETIGKHRPGMKFSAADATWVLTVPDICNKEAKQFMREAATEAGLVTEPDSKRLNIAPEPEAASVFCKKLLNAGFIEEKPINMNKETQFMVVDCGDGAITITVHEMMKGGHLKVPELHKVSGNDMGGQRVDKNFRLFLREIFSDEVFDEFEKNHPNDLQRLMYEFSFCKRSDKNVSMQCPGSLQEIASKEENIEAYFYGVSGAKWECGSIVLSQEKIRSLHGDSLRAIERQIRDILKNPNLKISYIFLVGGFALSPHVNKFVRQKFGSQCTVIRPPDAQVAVLKGAVKCRMKKV